MRLLLFAFAVLALTSGIASAWDLGTAKFLAQLNAIAYCPTADILAWKCPTCPQLNVRSIVTGDLLAVAEAAANGPAGLSARERRQALASNVRIIFLDNGSDTLYVVFKGTDPLSWTQWATDATISMVSVPELCNGCKIHSGFLKAHQLHVDEAWNKLQRAWSQLPNAKRLIITGHSLGAATGALFALYVRMQHNMNVEWYSMGEPRLGNSAFANLFNSQLPTAIRGVHARDLVPHLPTSILSEYHHEGLLVYCDDSSGVNCKEMPGAEDDGGILHISVEDHGQYFGVNFFPYLDIGSQSACKAD